MVRQLGFGIIGAGEIAQTCAAVFKDNPQARVAAVADVNRELAEKLAKDSGASAVGDYRELLKMKDVDAVYVATPPFLHRQMVLDALNAGKHVICEKPLMMNAAEVREIIKACEGKKDLKVASCSSRFLTHCAELARKMVGDGSLGTIERLQLIMSRAGKPVAPNWTNWRASMKQSGGGLVMDWGVYDLDFMSFVLGDAFKPKRLVSSLGRMVREVESVYAVQIFCDGGLRIDWQRRGGEFGPTQDWVELRGSQGGMDVPMVPTPRSTVVYRLDEGGKLLSETLGEPPPGWGPAGVWPIRDFIAAISEDRDPLSPPSRQLLVHKIIDAVYASAKSGQVVDIQ